ncbi:MAG TPA: S8 family serine peptidase, partial [Tepidisphaeraceae bacterium]
MKLRSVGIVGVLFLPAAAARAVPQNDLSSVSGDTSRSYLGRGRHVLIGILDGGIDANHPAIRGSVVAARDFSGSGTTDDDRTGVGHATGLASLYVGHADGYTGLVPKAGIINARVITSKDYTDDRMAGNGLFYSLNLGAKVLNMSFGNNLGDGPLTDKFNLMCDYASENYGASIVTAAGNDDDSAVAQVPAGAYNAYSIGALAPSRYDTVSSFSNFALRSDRRTKPDIVAPGQSVQLAAADWERASEFALGSGTSFATPVIGGVLAQMVGYGQDFNLPTDPRLLKAIAMTSATKVYDSDGTAWAPRHQVSDKKGRITIDEPLDPEQGAGRINAMGAYHLYSKARDASTAVANWVFTSLKRRKSYVLNLGHLNAGQRLDTTLVWDRHVGRKDDGDGVVDAGDRFFEAVPLADFVLTLAKDGRNFLASDSDVDNLEELSYTVKSSGNYTLEVYRYSDGGMKNETFALAAQVLNHPPTLRSVDASPDLVAQAHGVSRSIDEP